MRRVVVTGMAGISSLGQDWPTVKAAMEQGKSGIVAMDGWQAFEGMNTRLAGPVAFERPSHYSRKQVRSHGRVSLMATRATELALERAGLLGHECLNDGRTGIAYGSSIGSTAPITAFAAMLERNDSSKITATSYIQMMGHTTCVNVSLFFGLKGRVIPTSSACTSGSQAIGYAYEAIKYGKQELMVAGGAEELCPTEAAVFDTLYATSTRNGEPGLTPRPFDAGRDGLVIGEGAGTLVLESLEHAKARGANILAEIVGFGSNCDGAHVTSPTSETMEVAMRLALKDADLAPQAVQYVSAHGTATEQGDIAESQATSRVFGAATPISSLKGYFGHTLGACGALEAWLGIEMMHDNWFAPTLNLDVPDPRCGELDYIQGQGRALALDCWMSNNFAFGGINTSLVFKRFKDSP
ncbi:beta-ketoacyl-ACP synthase [Gallaecimonas kandeliae]|uniref:beta-ketoacyl-ACP synthase n=1 Tax=Gallaecimonas kandeliae TaxID=3029055 RepID=UPI002648BCD1|nr:beta-ketoacyl-ACP synthase [Gallaecimonas kandeliae]WKE63987.1 beta-ketoacyl-ACP synthase [Gallaecimonas kandeliae]